MNRTASQPVHTLNAPVAILLVAIIDLPIRHAPGLQAAGTPRDEHIAAAAGSWPVSRRRRARRACAVHALASQPVCGLVPGRAVDPGARHSGHCAARGRCCCACGAARGERCDRPRAFSPIRPPGRTRRDAAATVSFLLLPAPGCSSLITTLPPPCTPRTRTDLFHQALLPPSSPRPAHARSRWRRLPPRPCCTE